MTNRLASRHPFENSVKSEAMMRVDRVDWAMTQNNLGTALQSLGECERGTARLEEAVTAYDAALAVFIEASAKHDIQGCQANKDMIGLLDFIHWRGLKSRATGQ